MWRQAPPASAIPSIPLNLYTELKSNFIASGLASIATAVAVSIWWIGALPQFLTDFVLSTPILSPEARVAVGVVGFFCLALAIMLQHFGGRRSLPFIAAAFGLYSPERTTVTIATALEAEVVRVSVADRGFGIPAEAKDRVWDKFFRVVRDGQEKDEESTGLGLSFVREVVEQHGGQVDLNSEEGRGSTFSFTLPRL
jgi:Histidine kinase-, DNA gyrase B-, and HSP90-like ATPase